MEKNNSEKEETSLEKKTEECPMDCKGKYRPAELCEGRNGNYKIECDIYLQWEFYDHN